jgi:hypothetical protein
MGKKSSNQLGVLNPGEGHHEGTQTRFPKKEQNTGSDIGPQATQYRLAPERILRAMRTQYDKVGHMGIMFLFERLNDSDKPHPASRPGFSTLGTYVHLDIL